MFETILIETEAGVTTIRLNRPEVMNALSSQMRRELVAAFVEAEAPTRATRVIVLTGAGRAFSSGQDLNDASAITQSEIERLLNEEYVPMLRAIAEATVPVIAAVNGTAAGAGANLALGCDVVIAAESASFVQAFTRIGLIPDAGGTHWLPRQIGLARAMGAALFADKISARQAADWGMIWEAVADGDFAAQVSARARHLAQGPTVAYRALKGAMRGSFNRTLEENLANEARLQGICGETADFAEGTRAFLEKRAPKYRGA